MPHSSEMKKKEKEKMDQTQQPSNVPVEVDPFDEEFNEWIRKNKKLLDELEKKSCQ